MLCCWFVSVISMNWLYNVGAMTRNADLGDCGAQKWMRIGDVIDVRSKTHRLYSQYLGLKKVRKTSWRKLLTTWVLCWILVSFGFSWYVGSQAVEKRKETLASMCDETARMLQDQFNVSMNHLQALSIFISTFHDGKNPSAFDQRTFARYMERKDFEMPYTSGVAYAVRVLHSEREQFEKQQGWTIKKMDTLENWEMLEPSPIQEEYAPIIFAQDTVAHVISIDVLSGEEDRENVLRARASGKGVLTAPFRLIKTNRWGVVLTFAVYKKDLPSNATPNERIEATEGYLGGVFDIEALVEKLLQQLASKQTILVNAYDMTNLSNAISMYGSNVPDDGLLHVSALNFGDPYRKHEMHCRFKQKASCPWFAITTAFGVLVIFMGQIFHATVNLIAKVENDCYEIMELKKHAEAADVAKSQFLSIIFHSIRTLLNGVLGMLRMLMDRELDVTQQDYVRTAQTGGKALVSLINEAQDQAKIESGKLGLKAVCFNLRTILDDVLSLFSRKSQEKGVELAVYVSDNVPEMLIGDPGRFRQIVTNLMGNSIKFTRRGHVFVTVCLVEEVLESIEVETEASSTNTLSGLPVADRRQSWVGFKAFCQEKSTSSCLSSSPDNISLLVSIEDTGVGIPLDAQDRIFTPFMQVRPSIAQIHGGAGIGLSISKGLVHLMKGEIGFVSLPKIGSTFTFTAVFSSGCFNSNNQKSQQVKNQSDSISLEFRGLRALVVDHRPVRAMVSKYHIQRLGVHVEVVPDLHRGFSSISTGKTPVNIVVIEQEVWDKDFKLSRLFLCKLQTSDCNFPPRVFLLANSISFTKVNVSECGVSSPFIIMKPLRASMLAAALQCAMGVGDRGNYMNGELSSFPLCSLLVGRKILVVDDNSVNLKVAAAALQKYGADVVCADSGRKAVSLLRPPHQFDACFMDIRMPEMDGFEATEKIRSMEFDVNHQIRHGEISAEAYRHVSNWHVPILAMTADVMQATNEECLRSGMDGYVSKPFEAEQLYCEVSRFF